MAANCFKAMKRTATLISVILILAAIWRPDMASAPTASKDTPRAAQTAPGTPEPPVIPITPPAPETTPHEPPAATEEPTKTPSRYAGITLTDEDVETLARLVWLEARGEPFEGQVAVVEVVFNRVLSASFPDTVDAVVYQKNQFTPAPRIQATTAEQTQYDAVWAAYEGENPITDQDVVYFSTGPQNDRVFAKIGNHYFCRE